MIKLKGSNGAKELKETMLNFSEVRRTPHLEDTNSFFIYHNWFRQRHGCLLRCSFYLRQPWTLLCTIVSSNNVTKDVLCEVVDVWWWWWSHNVSYLPVMVRGGSAAACRRGLEWWVFLRILFDPLFCRFIGFLTVYLLHYPPMSGILKNWVQSCCWHIVLTVHRLPKMLGYCPQL